jgi:hypothetical protein
MIYSQSDTLILNCGWFGDMCMCITVRKNDTLLNLQWCYIILHFLCVNSKFIWETEYHEYSLVSGEKFLCIFKET